METGALSLDGLITHTLPLGRATVRALPGPGDEAACPLCWQAGVRGRLGVSDSARLLAGAQARSGDATWAKPLATEPMLV